MILYTYTLEYKRAASLTNLTNSGKARKSARRPSHRTQWSGLPRLQNEQHSNCLGLVAIWVGWWLGWFLVGGLAVKLFESVGLVLQIGSYHFCSCVFAMSMFAVRDFGDNSLLPAGLRMGRTTICTNSEYVWSRRTGTEGVTTKKRDPNTKCTNCHSTAPMTATCKVQNWEEIKTC